MPGSPSVPSPMVRPKSGSPFERMTTSLETVPRSTTATIPSESVGTETDEVGDREGPETHALRLRAEGALDEIDPVLHVGGLRDADEDGELLALLLAHPREQAVVEDGVLEIERERRLELERQHVSEFASRR